MSWTLYTNFLALVSAILSSRLTTTSLLKLVRDFNTSVDVIQKNGPGDISCTKASQISEAKQAKQIKLLNLIYNKGTYYIYHPGNPEKKYHLNAIDNYLWKIIKFAPLGTVKLREGDTVRFGRIPFKVSRIFISDGKAVIEEDEFTPGRI